MHCTIEAQSLQLAEPEFFNKTEGLLEWLID
jgi:hypothetical protein